MSFVSCVAYPDGYIVWYLVNYHGSVKGPKTIGELLWIMQCTCQVLDYGYDVGILTLDGGAADELFTGTGRKKNGEYNGADLDEIADAIMAKAPSDNEDKRKHIKLISLSSRLSQAELKKLLVYFFSLHSVSVRFHPFSLFAPSKWLGVVVILKVCLDLWHVLKAIRGKLAAFARKFPDPAISGRTAVRYSFIFLSNYPETSSL